MVYRPSQTHASTHTQLRKCPAKRHACAHGSRIYFYLHGILLRVLRQVVTADAARHGMAWHALVIPVKPGCLSPGYRKRFCVG